VIQKALVDCGFCHKHKKLGFVRPVGINDISTEGHWMVVDFDVMNLPGKTTIDKMVRPATMHHVRTLVGRPVKYLNTVGLAYVVDMREPHERRRVQLPELVDFERSFSPSPFYIGIGMEREGHVWLGPEDMYNWIVAGSQKGGKSSFLRLLVHQMVMSGWQILIADPDQATFNANLWRGAKCLVGGHVAIKPNEVDRLFDLMLAEIDRRSALFGNAPDYPDNLIEYNEVTGESLPHWGLIVDEANTFLASSSLREKAVNVSQRGRKWGLHVILAAHNWRAEQVSRDLSAMLQNRMCFRVNDNTSGMVVLERSGMAESIPFDTPGRAWGRVNGRYHYFQPYHLEKKRLIELVKRIPKVGVAPIARQVKPMAIKTAKPKLTRAQSMTAFIVGAANKGWNCADIQRSVWAKPTRPGEPFKLGAPSGPRAKQVKAVLLAVAGYAEYCKDSGKWLKSPV